MVAAPSRRMAWLLAAVLQCPGLLAAMPAQAASALAAWAMTDQGVLQLRTSRNAQLKAFFQAAGDGLEPGSGSKLLVILLLLLLKIRS